jgi:hypothetical protein
MVGRFGRTRLLPGQTHGLTDCLAGAPKEVSAYLSLHALQVCHLGLSLSVCSGTAPISPVRKARGPGPRCPCDTQGDALVPLACHKPTVGTSRGAVSKLEPALGAPLRVDQGRAHHAPTTRVWPYGSIFSSREQSPPNANSMPADVANGNRARFRGPPRGRQGDTIARRKWREVAGVLQVETGWGEA